MMTDMNRRLASIYLVEQFIHDVGRLADISLKIYTFHSAVTVVSQDMFAVQI